MKSRRDRFGFEYWELNPDMTGLRPGLFGPSRCAHCKKRFVKRTRKMQFCSANCRVQDKKDQRAFRVRL